MDLQKEPAQEVSITVRNFRDTLQRHRIVLHLPPGVTANPSVLEGSVGPKSRQSFQVKITADPAKVPAGVQMVPLDITLDDRRYGELFDFIILARELERKDVSR